MIVRKSMENVAAGDDVLFFGFDCALQHLAGRLPSSAMVRQTDCDFSGWLSW
jgi:hypothetical protein